MIVDHFGKVIIILDTVNFLFFVLVFFDLKETPHNNSSEGAYITDGCVCSIFWEFFAFLRSESFGSVHKNAPKNVGPNKVLGKYVNTPFPPNL
jgi:hypothetical protein